MADGAATTDGFKRRLIRVGEALATDEVILESVRARPTPMGEPQPKTIMGALVATTARLIFCGSQQMGADWVEWPWGQVEKVRIWHHAQFGPDRSPAQRVTIAPRDGEPFVVATSYYDPRARRIADMAAKPSLRVAPTP